MYPLNPYEDMFCHYYGMELVYSVVEKQVFHHSDYFLEAVQLLLGVRKVF